MERYIVDADLAEAVTRRLGKEDETGLTSVASAVCIDLSACEFHDLSPAGRVIVTQ